MGRPKKINDENKPLIAEDMKTMTRSAVCEKWKIDYAMLRREFGNAWTHQPTPPQEAQH